MVRTWLEGDDTKDMVPRWRHVTRAPVGWDWTYRR